MTSHDNGTLIVDHIEPLEVRPDLRLDEGNMQVLCHYHHEVKHGRMFKGSNGRKNKWADDEFW